VETLDTGQMIMADDQTATDAIGGVILRFAGARYAVDMSHVAEVVPVPSTTRVPGGPPWLAGVVNWRGRVLPVVDLRPLVGAPLSPMPTSARLVVLVEGDVEVGLIADMVPGLLDCDPESLEPLPATVAPGIAPLVRGVVDFDGPVALLETQAVLALRSQVTAGRR
jgi:chemotaxis signal transduction protein